MSWSPALDPQVPMGDAVDAIDTLIIPRARDLGGFEVRRALPAPKRQMVGPFIFFDQMGPAEMLPTKGLDVRPHPHIGLATISYLHRGRMHHRDSLGTDRWIEPGDVNLMVAGRGITHSERTDDETQTLPMPFFGLQTWIALPEDQEEDAPDFHHARSEDLPILQAEGKEVRLILGEAYGARAPVPVPSEMFYADAVLEAGAALPLPDNHEDRGIYVTEGSLEMGGETFGTGQMMVFRPGDRVSVTAGPSGARLVLLGGATLNGPRHIWWNFVSSSRERINEAKEAWRKADWASGPFHLPPGDDEEFIPLPVRRAPSQG